MWGAEAIIRSDYAPTLVQSDDQVAYITRRREELKRLEGFVLERGGSQAIGWLRGLRALADDEVNVDQIKAHPSALSCLRAVLNWLVMFFRLAPRSAAR